MSLKDCDCDSRSLRIARNLENLTEESVMGLSILLVAGGGLYWVGKLKEQIWLMSASGLLLGALFLYMTVQGGIHPLPLLIASGTVALAWSVKIRCCPFGQPVGWSLTVLALLWFGFDAVPGLASYPLQLGESQIPFSPTKIFLLLVVPFLVFQPVEPKQHPLTAARPLQTFVSILFVTLAILVPLAVWLDQARWGWPTSPAVLVAYDLAYNLVFVCTIEESFFRGIIQTALIRRMRDSNILWADGWALLLTSVLFGLAHWGGGYSFVLLATLAGLSYGVIYYLTCRLEQAVLLHFAVNAVHQLFLAATPAPSLNPA